jgi:MFS family permease
VLVAVTYIKSGKAGFTVALAVASAAWFSLYVMPALKYPLLPDVVFDPTSAGEYGVLFAAYSTSSALAALGSAVGFAKTGRKNWYFGAAGAYLAIVAGLYAVFPSLPEPEFYDATLLGTWRSTTAAGMTAFWFTLGILAGALLEREEKKGAGRGI